ncbi:MAG: Flp pilus assembly protein CpaB [Rhodospirillales bacterium]|nr:Flp pilus assembly protein CpaB [Rhodospirillales bacterium]
MRRYRTVILVLVFGVVPIGAALVLGVTVILPSLQQTEVVAELDVVVEEEAPPPEPVMVRMALTAAGPLSPGMLLTDGDVALEVVRDDLVRLPEERYVYVDRIEETADTGAHELSDVLRGYAVRGPVAAGEPVVWSAVVSPGDSQFLATVLRPGQVAVSIPVSLANQRSKLVSPGNRVDVHLVIEQDGELLVRTIVEDVRVIAVNSDVIAEEDVRVGMQGQTEDDASSDASADAGPEVTTVTLEVSPVQGEHLALGAYEGQLSLAIRPQGSASLRSAEPVQNLRSVLGLPEPEPEPMADPTPPPPVPVSVRVVRGTSEEQVLFGDDG